MKFIRQRATEQVEGYSVRNGGVIHGAQMMEYYVGRNSISNMYNICAQVQFLPIPKRQQSIPVHDTTELLSV